jgi:hypothetical protein
MERAVSADEFSSVTKAIATPLSGPGSDRLKSIGADRVDVFANHPPDEAQPGSGQGDDGADYASVSTQYSEEDRSKDQESDEDAEGEENQLAFRLGSFDDSAGGSSWLAALVFSDVVEVGQVASESSPTQSLGCNEAVLPRGRCRLVCVV